MVTPGAGRAPLPPFQQRHGWGQSFQPPEAGGLRTEPPAIENFAFFCKNNLIFGAIVINNVFKTWHRNWQHNMIQLVALMGYVGGG